MLMKWRLTSDAPGNANLPIGGLGGANRERYAASMTLDFHGVLPVPPLARQNDSRRSIDFAQNERLVRHMAQGGITRLIYGGNALLYHITLADYEPLLDWLSGFKSQFLVIPSVGPSYGRAMDQAPLLRQHRFPCALALPCGDPRDALGLEQGLREIAAACETPLLAYLKDENNFGADKEAGLDAVARLIDSGVCVGIKYAVVRDDPSKDKYLESLLQRVDRSKVISGIGERPAICHLRDFGLNGFTTGSGCIAPRLSNEIFEACSRADYDAARTLRADFLPLEDLRDAWGPSKVLHFATALAGLSETGPILPYSSPLSAAQQEQLAAVAQALVARNSAARGLAHILQL
jgi:dihydrodipicolinate synthase/N-acetylneuraminate lyase